MRGRTWRANLNPDELLEISSREHLGVEAAGMRSWRRKLRALLKVESTANGLNIWRYRFELWRRSWLW